MPPDSKPPRTTQVVLGVFICWQLWFLFSQNLFGLLEDSQEYLKDDFKDMAEHVAPGFTRSEPTGHVWELTKTVSGINKPWAHLTGQAQNWSLFSGWYNDCVFPTLLFLWDDADPLTIPWAPWATHSETLWHQAPILAATNPIEAAAFATAPLAEKETPPLPPRFFPSDYEPADVNHYFRWWQMRMRRYENNIVTALDPDDYPDLEERLAYYERRITKHVNRKYYLIQTYFKWRYAQLKPALGDLPPPKYILLLQHRYRTEEPDKAPPHVTGPYLTPLVRWRLPEPEAKGDGTFQRYEPSTRSFRNW